MNPAKMPANTGENRSRQAPSVPSGPATRSVRYLEIGQALLYFLPDRGGCAFFFKPNHVVVMGLRLLVSDHSPL